MSAQNADGIEPNRNAAADNTERFTGKGAHYAAARPAYAPEFLSWLAGRGARSGAAVADIGAGTGKLTEALLALGCSVAAVEPNADMRAQADALLGGRSGYRSVAATAENTTLPAGSVDLVTAAQAFHWFDAEAFRQECRRILRSGGRVALVWNLRVASAPINAACEAVCRRHCAAFRGFTAGLNSGDARISAFFENGCERRSFANDIVYTKEQFVRRQLSSSYAPPAGDPACAAFAAALAELFDRYAAGGLLTVPNVTEAYLGEP